MSVVNVKVKYIRPEYKDLKEWTSDSNNVYIGRRGIVFVNKERYPKNDSIWANPFRIKGEITREDAINKYRKYMEKRLESEEELRSKLLELRGKKLGCWCCPESCHGDVLVDLINK